MNRARRARTGNGMVSAELAAAVAFVLLPVLLLTAALPGWVARRHAAVVAASDAARATAQAWPSTDTRAARALALRAMANHGVDPADVRVTVRAGRARGATAVAQVRVRMPGIGVLRVRGWWITVTRSVPAERYRSRE